MLNMLKFTFTAQDRTAAGFRSVKSELGGVKGALAGVHDYATRAGRSMRNIGAGMSVGVTAPLMLLGKQSISLYDQQVKAEAAVSQAILSTGGAANRTLDDLKGLASGLQGVTTFGDEDILRNVTAPLLTFTKVQDEVFDRAQANVLDMATMLKTDLKSASILVGKALNDPVKGVSALSDSGVQFTESQKKVIKSLVETGDAAGAQVLILKELETQFKGQAAAAANSPLGLVDQLRGSIGDLQEDIGAQVSTFIVPLIEDLKGAVAWFSDLSPEVKKNIVLFGGLAAATGPLIAGLGLATLGVTSLVSATIAAGGALTLMTGPVGLLIGGLGLLVGAAAAFWPEQEKVKVATDNLTGALGDEITQSQLLSGVLKTSSTMSVDAARTKLQEARSRHENVAAIIAENRALALGSTEYSDLTTKIKGSQAALNSLGFPARDVATPMNAERFEGEQLRLAGLLTQRQNLLKADEEMALQLERTKNNVERLSGALSDVRGNTVDLGNSLIVPIDTTDRLSSGVSGLGGAAKAIRPELGGMAKDLAGVDTSVTKLATNIRDELSGTFSNAFTAIFSGTQKVSDGLADLARQVTQMAMNKAFTSLFDSLFSGVSWFGGGAPAPVVANAKGNAFAAGRIVPFANGGVVSRATAFPMRGGTGLMGEAGPEAIMPLSRGPDGKLGVRAAGRSGGDTNLAVNIVNSAPGTEVREVSRGPDRIDLEIVRVVKDAIAGGRLDRENGIRYGLKAQPQGV